jgi:hypothetical protein
MRVSRSKSKVLSFRPDEGTECFFDAVSLIIFSTLFFLEKYWIGTDIMIRGRCDANDQFVSFENDDTGVSADLTKFDWIADVESFLCSEQIER